MRVGEDRKANRWMSNNLQHVVREGAVEIDLPKEFAVFAKVLGNREV